MPSAGEGPVSHPWRLQEDAFTLWVSQLSLPFWKYFFFSCGELNKAHSYKTVWTVGAIVSSSSSSQWSSNYLFKFTWNNHCATYRKSSLETRTKTSLLPDLPPFVWLTALLVESHSLHFPEPLGSDLPSARRVEATDPPTATCRWMPRAFSWKVALNPL